MHNNPLCSTTRLFGRYRSLLSASRRNEVAKN